MALSIIIVNYRSTALIIECIDSIIQYNVDFDFEIIVVDNDSKDDGKEKIVGLFSFVKWVEMGYNSGFARANNAGMKIAKGDTFLLLNPDTISIDNSIHNCYQKLLASTFIAAGVQQINREGIPQISGNYFVKGGLNHLLPIPYWGNLIRWIGYKTKSRVPNIQIAKPIEFVDWISGAFLMVKRQAVERAGYMDEDFFLYGEEVEWCSRLRKVGALCIFGDLRIIHLEGTSINKDQNIEEKGYYNLYDKKGLQLMVSNHLRVRKQYGVFWFLFLLFNYTWGLILFFIISKIQIVFSASKALKEKNKVNAFAKNILKLWKLTPAIISNRPRFYKMF